MPKFLCIVALVALSCDSDPEKRIASNSSGHGESPEETQGFAAVATATDERECTVSEFMGIIKRCCQNPYSGTYNCTNFAAKFHGICITAGIDCRTVWIKCDEPKIFHAMNIVKIKGRGWCLTGAEEGIVYGCAPNPDAVPVSSFCLNEGGPPGCSCKIVKSSTEIIPPNTRPWECTNYSSSYGECTGCCDEHWWYKYCQEKELNGCQTWLAQCRKECTSLPVK